MEWNDIYDAHRNLTGRLHRRGSKWHPGEYGLVVCVWVYDGEGNVLMTKRAPEKTFAGTWENSGGAAKAGETSLQAIQRDTGRDDIAFYDYYCIHRKIPLEQIVLLPGETVDAKWVALEEVYRMIERKEICNVIAQQFIRQAPALRQKQSAQD